MCNSLIFLLFIIILIFILYNKNIENFNLFSSNTNIRSGASSIYNRNISDNTLDIKIPEINLPNINLPNINLPEINLPEINLGNNTQIPSIPSTPNKKSITNSCKEKECINKNNSDYYNLCRNCDITNNNNIDKYVLKSSIEPCNNFDMSKYTLKKNIKPCKVIHSENKCPTCPVCSTCPMCPTCPSCPSCPEPIKCKQIFDFEIKEHPDFNKYMLKPKFRNNTLNNNVPNNNVPNNNISNNNIPNNNIPNNNVFDTTKIKNKCKEIISGFQRITGILKPYNSCPNVCTSDFMYEEMLDNE